MLPLYLKNVKLYNTFIAVFLDSREFLDIYSQYKLQKIFIYSDLRNIMFMK